MAGYQIIDEPAVKPWGERIIVNPTLILFASIFVPLFITLPLYGRFWMPLAWLSVNGIALGSSTLRRELAVIWLGGLAAASFPILGTHVAQALSFSAASAAPYVRILFFGGFFLVLYVAVFNQQKSFELYDYVRRGRQ